MNIILLIAIVLFISLAVFFIPKMAQKKEAEKKKQEQLKRETNERIMGPEKKLHEEEKKRWEDEYWKRQERGER